MSDPRPPRGDNAEHHPGEPPRSVNLVLIYGLMFLALLIAIGLATLIVLPFYNRR